MDSENQTNHNLVQDEIPNQPPKQSSILPILFFLFGFLLLISTGLLIYQNWRLNQRLETIVQSQPTSLPSLTLTLTLTPTPDPTANWKTYTDLVGNFQFKYPQDYILDTSNIHPVLDEKISWIFSVQSSKDCQGDCPIVDSAEKIIISGQNATKIKGWTGDVGGNPAQSYIKYEISTSKDVKVGSKIFVITLQELPIVLNSDEMKSYLGRKPQPIDPSEEKTFDQILSTFKFVDQTNIDTTNWKTYPPSTMIGLHYSFKYPSEVEESEGGGFLVYLKQGNSTLFHSFVGKQPSLEYLIDNYQPFGVPNRFVFIKPWEPVSYDSVSGYKVHTADGDTFYFLKIPDQTGIIVFNYYPNDKIAEDLFNKIVKTITIR